MVTDAPTVNVKNEKVKKTKPFPFTTIIVTNPDEVAARSAQQLLDSTLKRYLSMTSKDITVKEIQIISTCDPFGARCGSFGGTLAALELVNDPNDTVLCLHAGGDSSRCPLSMILGKAWTNLPSSEYRNPITWLISELEELFYRAQLPKGSLFVVATDCIISLAEKQKEIREIFGDRESSMHELLDPHTVLGVAVPAPLTTSKNHGVYIMPEQLLPVRRKNDASTIQIDTPALVWQKPNVDKLLTNATTSTQNGILPPTCFEINNRSGKQAWIDTGIVIFLPKAYETVMDLSKGLLALCTRKGLEAAYTANQAVDDKTTDASVVAFAKSNALKIDLYTDILHNLPFGDKVDANANASVVADDANDIQAALKKRLSALPLQVLTDSGGSFFHIGTTQELIEFITTSPDDNSNASESSDESERAIPAIMDQYVTKIFAKVLKLNKRYHVWQAPDCTSKKSSANQTNTILYSTFPSNPTKSQLGSYTFVEYADLDSYESVSIGDHCMVSGWRRLDQGGAGKSLRIPDALSTQLLPLVSRVRNDKVDQVQKEFVMMVLGITDGIKTPVSDAEIYGVPFNEFFKCTGITSDQIGFQDNLKNNDCIWTANIHPVVRTTSTSCDESSTSFSSLFGWVEKLRQRDPNIRNDKSLLNWLSAERVSLKRMHSLSDASKERSFRMELEEKITRLQRQQSHIDNVVIQVKEQCQSAPCDLQWLMEIENHQESIDALGLLVESLERAALEEFAKGNFHITGRALMVASASIVEFVDIIKVEDDVADESSVNEASILGTNLIKKLKFTPSEVVSAGNVLIMKDIVELRKSKKLKFTPSEVVSVSAKNILIVNDIVELRRSKMSFATRNSMSLCSKMLEKLALCMIEFTITAGYRTFLDPVDETKNSLKRTSNTTRDKFVLSIAPVRVDLAGAWSDTPPITYENKNGGSVTGMAVLIDDHFPLSCRCRVISGGTGLFLKTELRDISTGSLLSSRQEDVMNISQLSDFRDPSANCALLKVSLICLGMLSEEQIADSHDIQTLINQFCSSLENVRLEIVTSSLLGMGTGMGTSSILGACIIQNLAECVGIGKMDDGFLIHAVLMLEQLLSSGGGWQDQAHGIVAGVKTVVSIPKIPLAIKIAPVDPSNANVSAFEDRLLFAFTGKTRLAKNILQQVLRRWAKRTNEIVDTVEKLVNCSSAVRHAFENGSWDSVAEYMYQSHKLKCVMAGENSGAEPECVKQFISALMTRGQIKGAMLCGAGGGGFLLLVMSQDVRRENIQSTFEKSILPLNEEFKDFSFHNCQIARRGLTSSIIDEKSIDVDTYQLSWQSSKRSE